MLQLELGLGQPQPNLSVARPEFGGLLKMNLTPNGTRLHRGQRKERLRPTQVQLYRFLQQRQLSGRVLFQTGEFIPGARAGAFLGRGGCELLACVFGLCLKQQGQPAPLMPSGGGFLIQRSFIRGSDLARRRAASQRQVARQQTYARGQRGNFFHFPLHDKFGGQNSGSELARLQICGSSLVHLGCPSSTGGLSVGVTPGDFFLSSIGQIGEEDVNSRSAFFGHGQLVQHGPFESTVRFGRCAAERPALAMHFQRGVQRGYGGLETRCHGAGNIALQDDLSELAEYTSGGLRAGRPGKDPAIPGEAEEGFRDAFSGLANHHRDGPNE